MDHDELVTRYFTQMGIGIEQIRSLYCKFDDYLERKYESALRRIGSRTDRALYSVESAVGAGKTSFVNNFVLESLEAEDFPTFLVKISLFGSEAITDLRRFMQDLYLAIGGAISLENLKVAKQEFERFRRSVMAKEIEEVRGKRFGFKVGLTTVLNVIPLILKVQPEVVSDIRKVCETKITRETSEQEICESLNHLINIVKERSVYDHVMFIIEDIDRYAGLQDPGTKARIFLNNVRPIFEAVDFSLLMTYAETAGSAVAPMVRNYFQTRLQLPLRVGRAFIRDTVDLMLRAASNQRLTCQTVFGESAIDYFASKNNAGFPIRSVIKTLNELYNYGKLPSTRPITADDLKSFEDEGLIFSSG